MLRALARIPGWLVGPLMCRALGHHWHVWSIHAATPIRVCVRCSFVVSDPYRKECR